MWSDWQSFKSPVAKWMMALGILSLAAWVPIIAWVVYLGITDSWISDCFFWWEFVSIPFAFGGLIIMRVAIHVEFEHRHRKPYPT